MLIHYCWMVVCNYHGVGVSNTPSVGEKLNVYPNTCRPFVVRVGDPWRGLVRVLRERLVLERKSGNPDEKK